MFSIADLESRILQNGFATINIVSDFTNEIVSTCDFNDVSKAVEYCEGLDYELFAFIV